jgi:serine/threonine protein kinase
MNIVSTLAADNSMVEFNFEDPKQGGVKDVYFHPGRQYAVAFFRDKIDYNGRERLEKLVDTYRKNIFEQEGAEFWKKLFRWPEKIVEYQGKVGIVVPFYEPHFFFPEDTDLGGCEKDGYWFTSAKNFNRSVPESQKGSLLGFLKICLNLSRATKRLHAAGLAHSDLSYKNCLVDPSTGNACIIDIDGLVVPGLFPPDVVGTRDFIAPEVVSTLKLNKNDPKKFLPCRQTDQHALSVLIYQYLFHRHPLRGCKVYSEDPEIQEHFEMGEKALFVEHPSDASNRIKIGPLDKDFLPWIDTKKLPYTIMGPHLKELFDQAFITGLHSRDERPTADDWVEAIVKTTDLLQPCSNPKCSKGWYVFDNTTKPICPYCNTKFKGSLPVLDLYSSVDGKTFRPDNHRVMVFTNQYLYQWHVDRNIFPNERLSPELLKPVGYFVFHKEQWIFINLTLTSLKDITNNRLIPIKEHVVIKNGLQLQLSAEKSGRIVNVSMVNA